VVVGVCLLAGCGAEPEPEPTQTTKARATPTAASISLPVAATPDPTIAIERTIRRFYRAISGKRFGVAWTVLSPRLHRSFGDYSNWQAGYSTTVSVRPTAMRVRSVTASRAHVTLILRAIDRGPCSGRTTQTFSGEWRLRRHSGTWIAEGIRMTRTSG
jgi:hypothetical protein